MNTLAACYSLSPQSAYVHIPFCRRRCFYCDFPIFVVGDTRHGGNSGTIAHYLEVLCAEIRQTPPAAQPLTTVFFGGGTPSLLTVAQLEQLLQVLAQQFGLAAEAEISLEIDPGTFSLPQIQGYRAAGVNRFSLGAQAFQPELLTVCGRSHTVADIEQAMTWLQQAAVSNISLDLISGLPHQTLAQWETSLERAIALHPTHLSCYDLTIEAGTPFSRQYKPGVTPLPSDETSAEMYRTAHRMLTAAGYEHYEISNYAKPGYQCRHNRVYWQNQPFYGFGMGATSYLSGERQARPRKTQEYYAWVAAQTTAPPQEPTPWPSDAREVLLDTLMLGLRLAEGISLAKLQHQFGPAALNRIWQCLQPFYQQGWVEWLPDRPAAQPELPPPSLSSGRIKLSQPEGFLFSNVILVRLFEAFA